MFALTMKREDYTLYFETLDFAYIAHPPRARARQLIATYLVVQGVPKSSHSLFRDSVSPSYKCNDGALELDLQKRGTQTAFNLQAMMNQIL